MTEKKKPKEVHISDAELMRAALFVRDKIGPLTRELIASEEKPLEFIPFALALAFMSAAHECNWGPSLVESAIKACSRVCEASDEQAPEGGTWH